MFKQNLKRVNHYYYKLKNSWRNSASGCWL